MGILVSIISYSKLSGNYNQRCFNWSFSKLYHILNCQGTITLAFLHCPTSSLYHILNCQGTITHDIYIIPKDSLYHILNCQGTITVALNG